MLVVTSAFIGALLVSRTSLVEAATVPPPKDFVTKFDDLPMTIFLSAAPIPGPQDGLLFGGINYKNDFETGINATSPPNAIAFGELGRLLGTS
ncbi:MAG: hypothetical protein Q9223_007778 [Gallowayella weberi]